MVCVNKLKDLLKHSYCPWSKFRVASIAIDKDGKEWVGVNVENAAFPSGICAERSALFGSVAHGAEVGTFKEIHIISSSPDFISPCAACRQVITEFMPDEALVYRYNSKGEYTVNTVGELIPFPIRSDQINSSELPTT